MTVGYPPGSRLPMPLQTFLFTVARGSFVGGLSRRHGDVFSVRLLRPYPENLVMFSRPEHIREIFAADPADLHAGEGNRVLGAVMGDHSLLLTDEAEHARARRLLMPAFSAPALRGYRTMVVDITKGHIDRWVDGSTVTVLDRMNDLTLDVIMQVVFGLGDAGRRAALVPRLRRIVNVNPIILLGWHWPVLQRFGIWRRFRRNQAAIDTLLYDEIVSRRAQPAADRGSDVLSRLLAVGDEGATDPLSDAELRDQLITLLLAGHETTASALSWACTELAAHIDVQDRARAAAVDGDDRYLEAVVKEAMRRHSVIGAAVRKLTRDTTIGGVSLPRGAVVSASIQIAHHRRDNFPDASTFRPERFLDGSVAANTWLPFGGGVRRCIGAGFSLMEGVVVLREILTRYRLALPPGETRADTSRIRNITNVPAHGAPVVVTAVDTSETELESAQA